jgi:hypothetical protein
MQKSKRDRAHALRRYGPAWIGLPLLLSVGAAACGDDSETGAGGSTSSGTENQGPATTGQGVTTTDATTTTTSGSGGGTGMINVEVVAVDTAADPAVFSRPFDATPSPDGSVFYFTGYDANGDAGVFSRAADGSGNIATLHAGAPLAGPFGLAVNGDGTDIYIADAAAVLDPDDDTDPTKGVLFVMANDGGNPTAVPGTAGFIPRGVEVADLGSGEVAVFTGKDPSGVPGLFATDGTTIVSGSPFIDPSGVAIAADDRIFVADTQEGGGTGRVFIVDANGTPSMLVENLTVGYPMGLALTADDSTLFVSGINPDDSTSQIVIVDVASGTTTVFGDVVGANDDSAGLHRAKDLDVFAWAGISGGAMGTGTIYRITLQ